MNANPALRRVAVAVGGLLLCVGTPAARADLAVSLTLEKPTYLLYESLIARVTVGNYTGRSVLVGVGPQATHRLEFSITHPDGSAVARTASARPPAPVEIPHGREADVVVDLVRLYRLRSAGMYRISAIVGASGAELKYRTPATLVEVVEGRRLWTRTVGIPSPEDPDTPAETRTYEILLNRIGAYDHLFLRIRAEQENLVYGVHPLGPYVPLKKPDVEFDLDGVIHILHQLAPRSYAHTAFRPDGKRVVRDYYSDVMSFPRLFLSPEGEVSVAGGEPVTDLGRPQPPPAPKPGPDDPAP